MAARRRKKQADQSFITVRTFGILTPAVMVGVDVGVQTGVMGGVLAGVALAAALHRLIDQHQ
jgi:hypothetical protein